MFEVWALRCSSGFWHEVLDPRCRFDTWMQVWVLDVGLSPRWWNGSGRDVQAPEGFQNPGRSFGFGLDLWDKKLWSEL